MRIVKNGEVPEIQGLLEGNLVMFFAEIDQQLGFCVVFGPEEKCIPTGESHVELWAAKVAFGKLGEEMREVKVKHGHKYPESMGGGGMVETDEGVRDTATIFFRRPDHEKSSSFEVEFNGSYSTGAFMGIFTVV
jgi:hypothetical protein